MAPNERRLAPRKRFALPVRFLIRTSVALEMFRGETVDLSDYGLNLKTPHHLRVGEPLEVYMTLPTELTGRKPEDVRCDARVVHVELEQHSEVEVCAGVSIQRFQRLDDPWRWSN
jgi:hypothetical protein